jgi:ferrous iron transport protein A
LDTLDNCPEGSTCIVKKLIGHDRNRLAELGLSTGTEIKIINCSGCNGPIVLEVRGYNLAIRKEQAEDVIIQLEGDDEKSV